MPKDIIISNSTEVRFELEQDQWFDIKIKELPDGEKFLDVTSSGTMTVEPSVSNHIFLKTNEG